MGPARFHCATLLLLLIQKSKIFQNMQISSCNLENQDVKFPIQAETSQLLALVRSVGVNEVGW